MATSTRESSNCTTSDANNPTSPVQLRYVSVTRDSVSFADRQKALLIELDRRTSSELRRRQRDWQYSVQRMRSGFLRLLPASDASDLNSSTSASLTDVIPLHKVRAQYFEYSDDEVDGDDQNVGDSMTSYKRETATSSDAIAKRRGRFQLRFDVSNVVPSSVEVTVDDEAITILACRSDSPSAPAVATNSVATTATTVSAGGRSFVRRVAKPDVIDPTRIRAFLSADGILTVEAPISPHVADGQLQIGERKTKDMMEDDEVTDGKGRGNVSNGGNDKVHTKTNVVVNGVACDEFDNGDNGDNGDNSDNGDDGDNGDIGDNGDNGDNGASDASVNGKGSGKKEETKKHKDLASTDDNTKSAAEAASKSPRGSTLDVHSSKVTAVDSPGGGSSGGTGGGTGDGSAPKEKIGVPIFRDESGTRRMHLAVDLGSMFRPRDVIVQVIKENRIQIRAKHRERSGERQSKNKFVKDYELGEKIEPFSLQGGLTASGKLIVCAYAKGHGPIAPE